MALRVTQQNVEALSDATGSKLRVTQFYVEVLGLQGAEVEASSSLGITDAASQVLVPGGISRDASSTLALTDSGTEVTIHSPSVASVLAFTQDVATDKPVEASSVLAFADQVNQQFDGVASSAMALTDSCLPGLYNLSAASPMTLVQDAISSIKNASASSAMALSQIVNVTGFVSASSVLALTDSGHSNIHPVSASSVLTLTDSHTKVLIHTLATVLSLDDDLERIAVFRRALSSNLALIQAVEIFIDREGVLCNYSPFVGSGDFTFDATPPVLTPSTLTLYWPFIAPSLTLELRNPEFGNKISFNANRINRKSRGGTIQVFRKETWPKFRTLQMDISVLSTTQITNFKAFLIASLGQEIGLIDHEGRTWKGVITTPDTDITETGGAPCGNYATSFQFEGEIVPP